MAETTKTDDRIALEQKAQDLGISFAPNIGDEKLADRIQQAEADAAANTDTQGADQAETSAQSPAEEPAELSQVPVDGGPETPVIDTAPADQAVEEPEVITVICMRPDGRRRAGRRWDEGATEVPVDALTDFQLAVLEADPLFRVTRPLALKA